MRVTFDELTVELHDVAARTVLDLELAAAEEPQPGPPRSSS